jgi:hypothetical protein
MHHLSLVEPSSLLSHGNFPKSQPPERVRLDELVARLAEQGKDASVDQALEIGRMVLDTLYGGDLLAWRSRAAKAHSLRALARRDDLSVSSSGLYRAVALYELAQNLGGLERWSTLGTSHLRLVLGLPIPEQRRLLDAAAGNAWTVAELEREAVAVRKRGPKQLGRGGRPRLPRFVKSINRLRKAAEGAELFADVEAAAEMTPERLAEIRDVLATIRVRCEALDHALERATAGC